MPPARSDGPRPLGPEGLRGRPGSEVKALLGSPFLVRRESGGGVEVWQYRAASCVLDVFLMGPRTGRPVPVQVDAGSATVAHAEARDRRGSATGVEACVEAVAAGQRAAPVS